MKIQQEITKSEKVRWLYQAKALDAKAHDLSSNWNSRGRQENRLPQIGLGLPTVAHTYSPPQIPPKLPSQKMSTWHLYTSKQLNKDV